MSAGAAVSSWLNSSYLSCTNVTGLPTATSMPAPATSTKTASPPAVSLAQALPRRALGAQAVVVDRQHDHRQQAGERDERQHGGRAADQRGGHRLAVGERPVGLEQRSRGDRDRAHGDDRQPRAAQAVGADEDRDRAAGDEPDERAARLRQQGHAERQQRDRERRRAQQRRDPPRRGDAQQRPEREHEQRRGAVAIADRIVEPAGEERRLAVDEDVHERAERDERQPAERRGGDGLHRAAVAQRHERQREQARVEQRAGALLDGRLGR